MDEKVKEIIKKFNEAKIDGGQQYALFSIGGFVFRIKDLDIILDLLSEKEKKIKELKTEVSYMDDLTNAKIEAEEKWKKLEERLRKLTHEKE